MPTINGVKMACQPCIRGHRSSKCSHANERLMVAVKKPGRPLSTCPHLTSQLCGCSTITAAIPRKQACSCGENPTIAPSLGPGPRPLASAVPDIPSPTRVSFKVSKPGSSGSSQPQPYNVKNFERMDPANVNVLPFLQPLRPQIAPAHSNGCCPPTPESTPPTNVYTFAHDDSGYQNVESFNNSTGPPFMPQSTYLPGSWPNGFDSTSANGYATPRKVENYYDEPRMPMSQSRPSTGHEIGSAVTNFPTMQTSSASASCCSSQSSMIESAVKYEAPQTPSIAYGGDCCPSSDAPHLNSNGFMQLATTQQPLLTDGHHVPSPFPVNQSMVPSYFPPSAMYEYDPQVGSYQHPLQPHEYQAKTFNMSNLNGSLLTRPHVLDNASGSLTATKAFTKEEDESKCDCGPDCQCLGCIVHPYNKTTREHVEICRQLQQSEPTSPGGSTDGSVYQCMDDVLGSPVEAEIKPRDTKESSHYTTPPRVSSTHARTTSDVDSSEEQTLKAEDYYFVNYTLSCGGESMSCPCGPNCICPGCMVHDNLMLPMNDMLDGLGSDNNTGMEMMDNSQSIFSSGPSEHASEQGVKSCCKKNKLLDGYRQ